MRLLLPPWPKFLSYWRCRFGRIAPCLLITVVQEPSTSSPPSWSKSSSGHHCGPRTQYLQSSILVKELLWSSLWSKNPVPPVLHLGQRAPLLITVVREPSTSSPCIYRRTFGCVTTMSSTVSFTYFPVPSSPHIVATVVWHYTIPQPYYLCSFHQIHCETASHSPPSTLQS